MGRRKTTAPARAITEGGVIYDNVLERVVAAGIAKAAPHAVPWLAGAGMVPVAAATHGMWGTAEALPWASAGLALSGAGLTAVTWAISRYRHVLGRLQSTGTTAVASGWLLAATITGPTARPTLDFGLWLGGTLAAAWNIRNVVRPNDAGDLGGALPAGRDLFKRLLTGTAEKAGMEVRVGSVTAEPHRITGAVELADGDTVEDLQRSIPAMEAAGRLPTGALVATPNPANAGTPTVTLSDPLLLEEPILWPGPSRPGGSIAEPLRIGIFQDGTTFEICLVGSHLQIMGMTGSAKSTGGGWTILGEIITRRDVVVLFVDVTKGEQTVGPLRPALHRVESTVSGARTLMGELSAILAERTNDLAARDLLKWAPGCGLPYMVLWIEEAADVFDHIDMEEFINLMRAIRSAGGSIVWSLQRADSTQMPTMVKGQGGAWMCFGVANGHDAGWGLSDAQRDAGAAPERWKNTNPGKVYAEVPGVAPERIAMAARVYDWGTTDERRVAAMRAHAAAWPAAAKPVDATTARLCRTGPHHPADGAGILTAVPAAADDDLEVTAVTTEYLRTEDPDPGRPQPDIDAELDDVEDTPLGEPVKLSPAEAREVLDRALAALADGRPFAPRDLGHVLDATGMGRAWIQKSLKARVEAGELEHDPERGTYRVRALAAA
ncbi:hypothetical protein [Streptosporangium pseudovulgare]|uniref:Sporulation protein SsgA n=1 Tax=Streptosporangium pseudovulgare TaxID=35765 RepID=A0ABQ2QXK0_9ACTN|nr:hypothetical protein [Streptosporangium pseudovulgare]GGP97419.1 sporulation protein SsgA [Streptosporangium pseudovulgare]